MKMTDIQREVLEWLPDEGCIYPVGNLFGEKICILEHFVRTGYAVRVNILGSNIYGYQRTQLGSFALI